MTVMPKTRSLCNVETQNKHERCPKHKMPDNFLSQIIGMSAATLPSIAIDSLWSALLVDKIYKM